VEACRSLVLEVRAKRKGAVARVYPDPSGLGAWATLRREPYLAGPAATRNLGNICRRDLAHSPALSEAAEQDQSSLFPLLQTILSALFLIIFAHLLGHFLGNSTAFRCLFIPMYELNKREGFSRSRWENVGLGRLAERGHRRGPPPVPLEKGEATALGAPDRGPEERPRNPEKQ